MTLKWVNHDKWIKRLKKLPASAEKYIGEANGKSANEMVQLARTLAPVKTGRLRDSIKATPPGQSIPKYSQGGISSAPENSWAITAGNEHVRYAHLVEFGTKMHEQGGTMAGTIHPGTSKQPFFWPAYRTIKKRHKGRISRAFNKSIKETKT